MSDTKHPIYEFVITGGPCAGKSTCLAMLDNALSARGIKVISVAETATEVITSGISPAELPVKVFQGAIMTHSLAKEKAARAAADFYAKTRPVVILYDRGICDNKAYMSDRDFQSVLRANCIGEIAARDQYTAIFHLVTAADGAEKFFTTANNTARRETPEQARELDAYTLAAWVGAQKLRVIDNSGADFDAKIKRLLGEVFGVIGLPDPLEIERKFLIKRPDANAIPSGAVKSEILQTYLDWGVCGGVERRVRQRGIGGEWSYFYTEKYDVAVGGPDAGRGARVKRERKIAEREYLSRLMRGGPSVSKDRHSFVDGGKYFELDIFPGRGRAILEVELSDISEPVKLPAFAEVVRDVTNDPAYRNFAIAMRGAKQLES